MTYPEDKPTTKQMNKNKFKKKILDCLM